MKTLTQTDLTSILASTPKGIRDLVVEKKLIIGGGFIRARIVGEKPSDIDLFGPSYQTLSECAEKLASDRGEDTRKHKTVNAFTVISPGRTPIQFITRWTFSDPVALIESFDFTICQACIYSLAGKWQSVTSDAFYHDLAGKRLVYTHPAGHEDAGGSLMRVRKFLMRGYRIQVNSFAGVIARLFKDVNFQVLERAGGDKENQLRRIIAGLLREVDPLNVIDGVDMEEVADDEDEAAANV